MTCDDLMAEISLASGLKNPTILNLHSFQLSLIFVNFLGLFKKNIDGKSVFHL